MQFHSCIPNFSVLPVQYFQFVVLRIKPRTLHVLCMHTTADVHLHFLVTQSDLIFHYGGITGTCHNTQPTKYLNCIFKTIKLIFLFFFFFFVLGKEIGPLVL